MTTLLHWRMRLRLLGTARLRLALVVAALAATTFTLLSSLPAHAEPTPTPTPSASAPAEGVQPAPTQEDVEAIEEVLREQSEKLSTAGQAGLLNARKENLRKLLPDEGGALGVFKITDANGLPISVYTVKSDTGGPLDWDLGIQNLLAEICFMITKWLIAFCCWLISWALSFGLAKFLLVPVLSVANSLHTRVILEMGLPSLFLALCAVICVARIFFGDKTRGWGDAALSILLAALTTTLLASTPQTLLGEPNGAIAMTRGLALEVAGVMLDASPTTPAATTAPTKAAVTPATGSALARPLTDALTDAFVVKPAMLLQYGRVFEGRCAAKYADTRLDQLVFDRAVHARTNKLKKITGLADYIDPTGGGVSGWYNTQLDMSTRWAVDHFGDPPMERFEEACVEGDADAAKKASLDKVGGALFLLVAAGIVTVLICGLAGSFLVAQCRIAWDAVRGEPALLAGTIPGAGRAFLWDWAASVLRSLGQMLTSVIALAAFIIIIQAVLNPVQEDSGVELTLRFLVVDIVCIGAVKKRKELSTRSKQVAANFRSKMSAARIGGTHGSVFTPPASSTVTKNHHIGRKTARGLVRGAMAGISLAHGNPLAAVGYAMPQSIGATALMTRLQTGPRRGRTHRARPAGRTRPHNNRPPNGPSTPPRPTPPGNPPQPAHPPRPAGPPRTTPPARPTTTPPRRPRTPARTTPGTGPTTAGNRPRRHIQAHRAVTRRTQQATVPPARSTNRASSFEDFLAAREEAELARRRRQLRGEA